MYSIGEFSKLTNINVKTLTWFNKIGLLNPDIVNPDNGYRYYSDESLQKVIVIKFLRSMDFSVNEIINFKKETVESKIQELNNKINFITMNINLLTNKGESFMDKIKIFEFNEELVNGIWNYKYSTTDFSDIIEDKGEYKTDFELPKHLIFGERNIGTDLSDVFGYSHNCFSLKINNEVKNYFFFIINNGETLIIYQKGYNKTGNNTITFNVYSRSIDNNLITADYVYQMLDRFKTKIDKGIINNKLVGKWEMVDYILDNQIKSYSKPINPEDAEHTLSPLYDFIEITNDNTVYILFDEEVELPNKTLTKENTKIKLIADENDTFCLNNTVIGAEQFGEYKQVDKNEFLFINLDTDLKNYYVFKKI